MDIFVFGILFSVFVLLLYMNVKNKSMIFGIFCFFVLIILGVMTVMSGISIPIGTMEISSNETYSNTTTIYMDADAMNGGLGMVNNLGLIFIGVAFYIGYKNASLWS